jgi:hypothetical protein
MNKVMDKAEHGTAIAVEDQMKSVFIAAFRPSHHARSYFRKRHWRLSVGLSVAISSAIFSGFLIFCRGYRIIHLPFIAFRQADRFYRFYSVFQFRLVSAGLALKVSSISSGAH